MAAGRPRSSAPIPCLRPGVPGGVSPRSARSGCRRGRRRNSAAPRAPRSSKRTSCPDEASVEHSSSRSHHPQRGMRLAGGPEVRFDPEVQGQHVVDEPTATPGGEHRRLGLLGEPHGPDVEGAGGVLAPGRHCQLHMVEGDQLVRHVAPPAAKRASPAPRLLGGRRRRTANLRPSHGIAHQEAPQAHAEEEAQEDAQGHPLATAGRRQVGRHRRSRSLRRECPRQGRVCTISRLRQTPHPWKRPAPC